MTATPTASSRTTTARSARFWFPLLLTCVLSACGRAPEQRLLEDTTNGVILPIYRDFAERSSALASSSAAFCASEARSDDHFLQLREHWQQAASGWAQAQLLQLGPLLVDNQSWKIQFWPDRKNLVARKVEQLIGSGDDLTPQRLGEASVIVQGLSALEYLLFDPKAGSAQRYRGGDVGDDSAARRCQMLAATATRLANTASALRDGWEPAQGNYAGVLTTPGADNSEYPEPRAALTALVDSLVYTVELIKRDKLERPLALAATGGRANPYLLEWWRAGAGSAAIAANLQGLAALYRGGEGVGLDDYLRKLPRGEALATAIEQQLAAAQQQLAAAGTFSAQPQALVAMTAPGSAQRQALLALQAALSELLRLLQHELPEVTGITLSFNANDGD